MAIPIKRAVKWNTFDLDATLGSHAVASNKSLKITRVHLHSEGGDGDYYLTDRSGTFDHLRVTGTLNPYQEVIIGNKDFPIYDNVLGTFTIHSRGSVAAGTYIVAWEGIES